MCGREADVSNFVRQSPRYSELQHKNGQKRQNRLYVRYYYVLDLVTESFALRKYDNFPQNPLQFEFACRIIKVETRKRQGIAGYQPATPL